MCHYKHEIVIIYRIIKINGNLKHVSFKGIEIRLFPKKERKSEITIFTKKEIK